MKAIHDIRVFDFDKDWDRVLEVLDHPLAIQALDAGMTSQCDNSPNDREWDPEDGPWSYSRTDYWCMEADSKFEEAGQYAVLQAWSKAQGCPDENSEAWHEANEEAWMDKYNELQEPFWPQPRTPDWYRCWGNCHWLAIWNCTIGELVYPELDWAVVKGHKHSTAIGVGPYERVYMDILWSDKSSGEIWENVRCGGWYTLEDELDFHVGRPYRCECPVCGSHIIETSIMSHVFMNKGKRWSVDLSLQNCECGELHMEIQDIHEAPEHWKLS